MCVHTTYTFGWHGDSSVVVKGATQTEFRGERRGRTGEGRRKRRNAAKGRKKKGEIIIEQIAENRRHRYRRHLARLLHGVEYVFIPARDRAHRTWYTII